MKINNASVILSRAKHLPALTHQPLSRRKGVLQCRRGRSFIPLRFRMTGDFEMAIQHFRPGF
ncbi:hypothetical protein [Hymenobacter fastidiosus]|uniref:hypothetical protein n=1 Tax=Hymenobacter fastidiosus TaxID=486264 RepID=UPI0031E93E77